MVQELGCYRVVATVKLELGVVIQSLNLIRADVVLLLQPLLSFCNTIDCTADSLIKDDEAQA